MQPKFSLVRVQADNAQVSTEHHGECCPPCASHEGSAQKLLMLRDTPCTRVRKKRHVRAWIPVGPGAGLHDLLHATFSPFYGSQPVVRRVTEAQGVFSPGITLSTVPEAAEPTYTINEADSSRVRVHGFTVSKLPSLQLQLRRWTSCQPALHSARMVTRLAFGRPGQAYLRPLRGSSHRSDENSPRRRPRTLRAKISPSRAEVDQG